MKINKFIIFFLFITTVAYTNANNEKVKQKVQISKSVQEHEEHLNEIEQMILELQLKENKIIEKLHNKRIAIARTLGVLCNLKRFSPVAFSISPKNPDDFIRSVILLQSVLPHFQEVSKNLKLEAEELNKLRKLILEKKSMLANTNESFEKKRNQLKELLASKTEKTIIMPSAANLTELVSELESPQTAHSEKGEIPQLYIPAKGKIITTFGKKTPSKDICRGVVIETRFGSHIVSPGVGRVSFAGPFRSYGKIVIIDHGKGFYSLIIGLDRLNTNAGEEVSIGEPLGQMCEKSDKKPLLTMELRKKNEPIDPAFWLVRE